MSGGIWMPLKNAREFVRERKEGRGRIEYRCYWKKVALVSRVLVSGSRSPPINRSRVYGNQFRWTVLLREREREEDCCGIRFRTRCCRNRREGVERYR